MKRILPVIGATTIVAVGTNVALKAIVNTGSVKALVYTVVDKVGGTLFRPFWAQRS